MGHKRLGSLPATKRWQQVVTQFDLAEYPGQLRGCQAAILDGCRAERVFYAIACQLQRAHIHEVAYFRA